MMFKPSQYNISVNVDDGLLLYNTFSGAFVYITTDLKELVLNILENKEK